MIGNDLFSAVSLLRRYLAPFKGRVMLLSLLLLGSIYLFLAMSGLLI